MIKVAIIEDQREIREALRELINGAEDLECTAGFASMEEALPRIRNQVPDVFLIDIGLPGMSGVEGLRIIKDRHPGVVLVVLTVFNDDRRILEAICAGASGYLLKSKPAQILIQGIRDAAEGGSPMSPEIAARVIALYRQTRPVAVEGHDLTPHEVRVLKLLVDGHSYKTAAAELNVTINTISFHMRRIYEKLQVHTKSEAVAKALRNQIVG